MKFFLTLLLAGFMSSQSTWLTNMQQAKSEAVQNHKYILLNFSGSDWCLPCIRMHKEIFNSASFEKYADKNLVLVNADFPRLHKNQLTKEQNSENEALAEEYNHEGKFPLTVLLDAKGNVVKSWDGFPNESTDKFIEEINKVVHGSN